MNWGVGANSTRGWGAVWGLGYADVGRNDISVELDAARVIAEENEAGNLRTLVFNVADSPDPKFINPVGGVGNADWVIGNRVDLDPGEGIVDRRGNPYSYNGHDAHDINLVAGWEQQAAGTPIYASAGGTVSYIYDGTAMNRSFRLRFRAWWPT